MDLLVSIYRILKLEMMEFGKSSTVNVFLRI